MDQLAEQSVGTRRGVSLRRRMSRGVSSFRRQVCLPGFRNEAPVVVDCLVGFLHSVDRFVYCKCLPGFWVEAPFVAECLVGFLHSVDRFVHRIMSSGFLGGGSLRRRMSRGVSSFRCLDLSAVNVFRVFGWRLPSS